MFFFEKRFVYDQLPDSRESLTGDDFESQRQQVLSESTEDRIDMNIEKHMTDEQVIASIDITKSPEEQEDSINTLESVCFVMIARLLERFEPSQIKQNILDLEKANPKSEAEKAAIEKIKEITGAEATAPMLGWVARWPSLVDRSYEVYKAAELQRQEIEESKGEAGKWGNRILTAGLIIGGAYLGYRAIKWLWGKAPDNIKNKAGTAKQIAGVGAALSAVAIGACLLSPDKVGKWVAEYLGVNISKDSLKSFISLMWKGDFSKAFASLSNAVEVTHPFIAGSAEKIGLDPKNLLILKDENYKDFMSFKNNAMNTALSYALDRIDVEIPFTFSAEEQARSINDERKLFAFLKRHESEIEAMDPQPTTIEEVLRELDKTGRLARPIPPAEGEDVPGDIEGDEDEILFKETLTPKLRLATQGLKESAKAMDIDGIEEGCGNVIEAALEDGWSIAVQNGVVGLIKGDIALVLSSADIILSFFKTLIETRSPVEGITTWIGEGGLWFVGAGATIGGVREVLAKGNFWTGARSGAVRGVLLPAEVLNIHWNAAQRLSREGRHWYLAGKEIAAPTPGLRLQYAHAKVKLHASLFEKYASFSSNDPGAVSKTRRAVGRFFESDRIAALKDRHMRKFAEAYNHYLETLKVYKGAGTPGISGNRNILGHSCDHAIMSTKTGMIGEIKGSNSEITNKIRSIAQDFLPKGTHVNPMYLTEQEILREATILAKAAGLTDEAAIAKFREQAIKDLSVKSQPKPSNPRLTSMAEADRLGLKAIDKVLVKELSALGVTEKAMLRMREIGYGELEIRQLIKDLKANPQGLAVLEDFMVKAQFAKYTPLLRNAAQYGGILMTVLILHGFVNSDDKADYLGRTTTELVGFAAGAKVGGAGGINLGARIAGGAAAGSKLPGGLKLVGVLAGGFAGAMGAGTLWDKIGTPVLNKHMPNRDKLKGTNWDRAVEGLRPAASWIMFVDQGEYLLDKAGILGRVDENTDPIEYLQDEAVMLRSFGSSGWNESIFKSYKTHDINQMRKQAQSALEDEQKDLDKLNAKLDKLDPVKDAEEIEELQAEIEEQEAKVNHLQSLTDDSWIIERKNLLMAQNAFVLGPAYVEFRKLASTAFKGYENDDITPPEYVDMMVNNIIEGKNHIFDSDDPKATQIWEKLYELDIEVEVPNGEEETDTQDIKFGDFILMLKLNTEQMQFMSRFDSPGEQKVDVTSFLTEEPGMV